MRASTFSNSGVTLIMQIERANDNTGAYQMCNCDISKCQRFTIFVRFTFNNDASDYCIEEIDVNAYNRKHASQIANVALQNDYVGVNDDGVTKIRIVRIQSGMYFQI